MSENKEKTCFGCKAFSVCIIRKKISDVVDDLASASTTDDAMKLFKTAGSVCRLRNQNED